MAKKVYIRRVLRYSPSERKLRLLRILFGDLRPSINDQKGRRTYSGKWQMSIALWPRIFHWEKGYKNWAATLLGLRVHLKSGLGGRCV